MLEFLIPFGFIGGFVALTVLMVAAVGRPRWRVRRRQPDGTYVWDYGSGDGGGCGGGGGGS